MDRRGRKTRDRGLMRAGLLALAGMYTITAVWMLFFPHSFYRDFPGLGRHWVSPLGPYNEHLVTDLGGALLGVSAALWLAAVLLERNLTLVVLVLTLVQSTSHFVYHLRHLHALPAVDSLLGQATLAVPMVLVLFVFCLVRRADGSGSDRRGVPK
ncbi:hypothetical protein [Nocardia mexicana]|uniref:Uncharacterized protein n=1 Tax=Nocardia mexicana TaxID=279262 RepID=A0A370GNQ3_9NOCA|nr:hypothetical protein [Nocardia mexicana]RDI45355.1 hypothetical protein DFR68_113126 [Nocardia mexicana]